MGVSSHTTIRRIITEGCKRKGLSLNKLALILGTTSSYLYDILSGRKTSRPLIRKIANFLELPDLIPAYEQFLHERRITYRKNVSQSKKAHALDKEKEEEKDGQKA